MRSLANVGIPLKRIVPPIKNDTVIIMKREETTLPEASPGQLTLSAERQARCASDSSRCFVSVEAVKRDDILKRVIFVKSKCGGFNNLQSRDIAIRRAVVTVSPEAEPAERVRRKDEPRPAEGDVMAKRHALQIMRGLIIGTMASENAATLMP